MWRKSRKQNGKGGRRPGSGRKLENSYGVGGFDHSAWPKSPEALSNHKLYSARAELESESESSESRSALVDLNSVRAQVAAVQLRLKKKCGKKGRCDAPMSSISSVHKPGNLSLSRKAFNRLLRSRDSAEAKVKDWS